MASLILDPLFGEYLRGMQESQLSVVEAKIEGALQDRRLQRLVSVQPSTPYDGPPCYPIMHSSDWVHRILEHLSSVVYSDCTSLGCRLGQVFTQRRLVDFPLRLFSR